MSLTLVHSAEPEALRGRMIRSAANAARFAMAGRAVFTLSSRRTGTRYTYRVTEPGDNSPSRGARKFVSVLAGPDNTSDYVYIGAVAPDQHGAPRFYLTRASKMTEASPPVRAFRYFCDRVLAHPDAPMPADLEVRHEGRCGKCGRALTVPESIDRGIGPECWEQMGGAS